MKSHDCHVFMQRLMPIAFRELLHANMWKAITEIGLFFKSLTTIVITNEDMARLELDISIILCKLERIFPLSFFFILWNIFQFTCLTRHTLQGQCNSDRCIHLRG